MVVEKNVVYRIKFLYYKLQSLTLLVDFLMRSEKFTRNLDGLRLFQENFRSSTPTLTFD